MEATIKKARDEEILVVEGIVGKYYGDRSYQPDNSIF